MKTRLPLCLFISMAGDATFIQAAPQLEEVIVTAQVRAESLADVPVSIAVVAGEKLESQGITDLGSLSAYVPSFQKADITLTSYISIRGVSSGANQGFEQSVVQYFDDVAMGRAPLARAPFMDVERIEVLRGPQNVLFGKNSIGGALSLKSKRPTDELEGQLLVEYEPDYNTRHGQFVLSGSLTDSLRARGAFRYFEEDGFYKNNVNGNNEALREDYTARLTFVWDVNDTLEASLKLEHNQFDMDGRNEEISVSMANQNESDPLFYGLTFPEIGALIASISGEDIGSEDGQQDYRRNADVEHFNTYTDNVTLHLNWDADSFALTSVTAYLAYNTDELIDADNTGIDLFRITQEEEYEQFSQEIRLVSTGTNTIDWIAGVYYQRWDLDYRQALLTDDENLWTALGIVGGLFGDPELEALGAAANIVSRSHYEGDSDTGAVFGQFTWNFSDTLRLTVGGRYTEENKSATRTANWYNSTGEFIPEDAAISSQTFGVDYENLGEYVAANGGSLPSYPGVEFPVHRLNGKRDESSFSPTVIVQWDAFEEAMVYFNWSRGSKAGGFDARGNLASEEDFEYDDESVNSFELGMKGTAWDRRLDANLALFYLDYTDLQVSQFDGRLGFVVGNAAQLKAKGVELDGRALLTDALYLRYAVAYLDNEFTEYETAACGGPELAANPTVSSCSRTGESNIYAPEWSASLGFDFTTLAFADFDFLASLDINYTDEQHVDPLLSQETMVDAHTLVNLRLALESEVWTVALVGKNLTDQHTYITLGDVPLAAQTFGAPSYSGWSNRPRTYTAQVIYRF